MGTTWNVPDNRFQPGDPVKIKGLRGDYTFVKRVHSSVAEWCEVFGGYGNRAGYRQVDPDRVVPNKMKVKRKSAKEKKEKTI